MTEPDTAATDNEGDHDTAHRIGPDPDDWCDCSTPEAHDA